MIYNKGSQKSEKIFSDITTTLKYLRSDQKKKKKNPSLKLPFLCHIFHENHQFFEGFEIFWNQKFFILKKNEKKKRSGDNLSGSGSNP
jgi:hypothetical protein